MHLAQTVLPGVPGDEGRRAPHGAGVHDPGAVAPALVRRLVHVAVVAREVAAAVDLQQELPEGNHGPASLDRTGARAAPACGRGGPGIGAWRVAASYIPSA